MKKIFLFLFILFCMSGCSSDSTTNTISDNDLDELRTLIEKNNTAIEELKKKNEELESKIVLLEEENKNLNNTIIEIKDNVSDLEDSDKTIVSSIDNNYNELKRLINSKVTSTGSYTISKSDLIGTWKSVGSSSSLSFESDNVEVVGNWIIYKGYMAINYMYRDGRLYISDDGLVMTK